MRDDALSETVLEVTNLSVAFHTRQGRVSALDGVSLTLNAGEMLGIVGESGSGKSVTSYAILGLLPKSARVLNGGITFEGRDLLSCDEREMRAVRGSSISMVFQNPRAALNPICSIGQQLSDTLRSHKDLSRRAAAEEAVRMLALVGIPDPGRRAQAFPFELSGGMCQRVMIALALACSPKVLIADEPTTGLDVTTQASIMQLLVDLRVQRGMSVIFITHDLSLAAENCDRIAVMHAGQVVEVAPTEWLFSRPAHPYSRALVASLPSLAHSVDELQTVPGALPSLRGAIPACRYAPRCANRATECDEARPRLEQIADGHRVACWKNE